MSVQLGVLYSVHIQLFTNINTMVNPESTYNQGTNARMSKPDMESIFTKII